MVSPYLESALGRYRSRYSLSLIAIGLFTLINTASAEVVINEIHYHPADKTSPEEFVELYNASDTAVDLSGWSLRDAVEYTIPPGTFIPAHGYVVIAENPAGLDATYGTTAIGPWTGKLSSSGERIELYDASDSRQDRVEYGAGFPWPTASDGGGSSAELINPGLDNDLGGSWRASATAAGSTNSVYVASSSDWKYRKGSSDASSPVDAWRATAYDDSSWLSGTSSFGYNAKYTVSTTLGDMRYNYSTVYYRKTFTVPSESIPAGLQLRLKYDDGAVVWINGTEIARLHVPSGELAYNQVANDDHPADDWEEITITNADAMLYGGDNVIAVQSLNLSQDSSDYYFDLELLSTPSISGSALPTPGAINSSYAPLDSTPPQIRHVDHFPEQPEPGEPVAITAKLTDLDGMGAVTLSYQTVDPGAYIRLTDATYETSWTQVAMLDDGTGGDEMAGDSIYTAVLPAAVQTNRRLVRYRIAFVDALGNSETVPYADDEQPNFAYYVYAGVPDWQGALFPGSTPAQTFTSNVLSKVPVYTLIVSDQDVVNSQYNSDYIFSRMYGTFVYDGEVYDHIQFRNRGQGSTYQSGKNKWKFYFNRARDLKPRGNFGGKYKETWSQFFGEGCSSPWAPVHRGMAGVEQTLSLKAYDLAGVPTTSSHYYHFRVVRSATETPPAGNPLEGDLWLGTTADGQYGGDFWGLYLAVEPLKGSFLDERNLPDGNVYKVENYAGDKHHQGETQALDASDWNSFRDSWRYSTPSQSWWETNLDLECYYSFMAINRLVGNVDFGTGSNYGFYHRPTDNRWIVIPWDLDMMFIAETHWRVDDIGNKLIAIPALALQYHNRAREILDLLASDGDPDGGQVGQLIREFADIVHPIGETNTWANADAAKWNMHPRTNGDPNNHSGQYNHKGNFFYTPFTDSRTGGDWVRWLRDPSYTGTATHEDSMAYLLDYATDTWPGGTWEAGNGNQLGYGYQYLAHDAYDDAIPDKPYIASLSSPGYPLNGLSFACSGFTDPQGDATFAAMEWRAGEILDTNAPAYDPNDKPPYELNAKWESGEITNFDSNITIPADALKVGHAYRVRVRMKDDTGRWSHWSSPVQFITTEASTAASMLSHLRISELMYDPPAGSDYEFVELHNTSTNMTLDLAGAAFTEGIDFNFPAGTLLGPDGYLLLIGTSNTNAFRTHYGLSTNAAIAGAYSGSLSNGGEELKLKTAPGGSEIAAFEYGTGRHWPLAAAGAGHSLVPIAISGQATGALDYPGNWKASAYIGGSPGAADPIPSPSLLLNEITAHTDYSNPEHPEYDSDDWVELYNASASVINLAGWYLSDDPSDPAKWACPSVSIPAGGYKVFTEVDDFHNPISSGFGLDKAGEQVLLSYLPGNSSDRVVDAVGFKGQENGRSLSRIGDYWQTTDLSQGTVNSSALSGLRISETMYQPAPLGTNDNTRDEYIEIYNPTASDVTMQSEGEPWRIDGGVEYTFLDNIVVPAGSSLLVVGFDPADTITSNAFITAYGITNTIRMFGPWSGKLGNRSEPVSLERPQAPDLPGDPYSWVIEDETVYGNQSPWPAAAGNGNALERLVFNRAGIAPANWMAASPSPGDAGTSPYADQDGDGMSDYDEWFCGTDPYNPESLFQVDAFSAHPISGLQWTAVSNHIYSVYWTEDLRVPFVPLATNLFYPQETFMDISHTNYNTSYYRLKVERQ